MSNRRELLIDAYNVIFAHPRFGPLVRRDPRAAREQFLEYVNANRPADATRVTVVFDAHRDPAAATQAGRQDRAYAQSVYVVFARETADVWIQRRVRASKHASGITVVTSDREILATVHAHGATHLRVSEFLHLRRKQRRRSGGNPADDGEKPTHTSKRELKELQRLFEERPDED